MPRALPFALAAGLAACGGGTDSNPVGGSELPPQLLACRARLDSPHQFAEVAARTAHNLGTGRLADRTGSERAVRSHPDGNTVVFVREREPDAAASRELFVATRDGSRAELRLTGDNHRDDEPCWSPDGSRILFTSERGGDAGLWTCAADGSDLRAFLLPPPGVGYGEADWHPATNRIVFVRRASSGRSGLQLVNGDGTGQTALSDGGAGSSDGDHAPAFAPDGASVWCVRRVATGVAQLLRIDVATGAVAVRHQVQGDLGWPRAAASDGRLFLGLAEPAAGRPGLRLATLPAASGAPVLLWPDARWELRGLDLLPGLGAAPAAAAPVRLDVERAQLQISAGTAAFGARRQLASADQDELAVATQTFDGREIAGINVRFDLPVAAAGDVLELRLRAIARSSRAGTGAVLRLTLYNPVDERFDTAVELPAATTATSLQVTTASLRHVTRERQLRIGVLADLPPGARSELRVDLLEVELVARRSPP